MNTFKNGETRASSYNRQHPMAYNEKGEMYDPLERDIKEYRTLFRNPQTINAEYIKNLPLSLGLLRSFAVNELGMENAQNHFNKIEIKYGEAYFSNVFAYVEAVNDMKELIKNYGNKVAFGDDSDIPPSSPPPLTMVQTFRERTFNSLDE